MPSMPVVFFNTNSLSIQVNVNNGPAFNVPAAAVPSWAPQSPPNGGPSLGNVPGPNVLSPGTNYVMITPAGSTMPLNVPMNLPNNVQWNSLQVYIFFNYGAVSWIGLNNGQFVTGGGT
jgi:hypothetical protein